MSNLKRSKLQSYLVREGITQTTLSKGIGISQTQISLFNRPHHNWNKDILKRMCVFLKCTPNDIVDYEQWLQEDVAKRKASKKNG